MNKALQRLLTASLIAYCAVSATHAATIMAMPVDSRVIDFRLTPTAFSPTNPPGNSQWLLRFGTDRVNIGDVLRVRLFENTQADVPLLDNYYDGSISLNGILGLFGTSENFQDLQGLLIVELFAGSVNLRSLFAETYVNGKRQLYTQDLNITLVPETEVGMILAVGGGLLLLRRRKSAAGDPR
jgi:hypothetical protein